MTPKELEAAKKELGLSAETICGEAGISLSSWFKAKKGECNPNTLKHLSIAINKLLTEKQNNKEGTEK